MSGSSFSNQEEKIHWIYLKKNQKDISSATKKKKKVVSGFYHKLQKSLVILSLYQGHSAYFFSI